MGDVSNIPIQAWLSYRCKDELAKNKRDELEAICADHNIKLVYDQSDAKEGDHLIEFMEDLSSARCVFIFLAPNYFESAYTLFEMVCIHERADLDQRFILPMRLPENMVTYEWTSAKEFWDGDAAVRNELQRLLKDYWVVEDHSHEAIWQRIDAAWRGMVFPLLDELHGSLESGDSKKLLSDQVSKAHGSVKTVIAESDSELLDKVREECGRILKEKNIPLKPLADALKLDTASEDGLASFVVEQPSIDGVLDALLKVSKVREQELAAKRGEWETYLRDIEQLCGWLLIKTVDRIWWFQQELSISKKLKENIASEIAVGSESYVEVIISRNLLQSADLKLDRYGDIVPASDSHDIFLFDAVSEGASDIELLTPVFKDLRRSQDAPQNVDKLLQGISRTAKSLSGSRDCKPIYYLVTSKYLNFLQEQKWYGKMQNDLSGYLHFVCCRLPEKSYESNPCQDDPDMILEKVANLLRLRNPKEL